MSFDLYRKKVNINGNNYKEEVLNRSIETFEEYLNNSPTTQDVYINNNSNSIKCVINESSIDKCIQLTTSVSNSINIGDVINWNNENYLIIDKKDLSIKSHIRCIIKKCNNILTFFNGNEWIEIPILAFNGTLYSLGIDDSSNLIIGDDKLIVSVPYNDKIVKLKAGYRFIFNKDEGCIYKLTMLDTITNVNNKIGYINLTLLSDVKHPNDIIDLNRAYNENTEIPIPSTNTFIFKGNPNLYINRTSTYEVVKSDGATFSEKFTFVLNNNNAIIESSNDKLVTLKGINKGEVELIGKVNNTEQVLLNIQVKSLI